MKSANATRIALAAAVTIVAFVAHKLAARLPRQSVPPFQQYIRKPIVLAKTSNDPAHTYRPASLRGIVRSGRVEIRSKDDGTIHTSTNSFSLASDQSLQTADATVAELYRDSEIFFIILPRSNLQLEKCETNVFDCFIEIQLKDARLVAINRTETFPIDPSGERFVHRTFALWHERFDIFNHDPAAFYIDTSGSIECVEGTVEITFANGNSIEKLKAGEGALFKTIPPIKASAATTNLVTLLNSLTNQGR